jgi:uncharacterized membrane protein
MITNIWPYILRLALAMYFVFEHLPPLLSGYVRASLPNSIFACTNNFLPAETTFYIWHGLFLILALLILLWPKPLVFLIISLIILFLEVYLQFETANYNASTLLILISILLNIALLIIYARRQYY